MSQGNVFGLMVSNDTDFNEEFSAFDFQLSSGENLAENYSAGDIEFTNLKLNPSDTLDDIDAVSYFLCDKQVH